jgi:hypothetical protein
MRQRVVAAYEAFNARDIDTALAHLHPKVQWDDGEGHMLEGHAAVRRHWQQQWAAADPKIEILELRDGPEDISARVRLSTREDQTGTGVQLDNELHFAEGLIRSMRIRPRPAAM